jgi:hypothetical protein
MHAGAFSGAWCAPRFLGNNAASRLVGAMRRLVLGPGHRWEIGPFAHTCASVVGISMGPSVVGRDWSPVSSNKARGYCCRTSCRPPESPPSSIAARRYLRVCRCIASLPPEVRGRAGARAASASYASCRSDSLYTDPQDACWRRRVRTKRPSGTSSLTA